MTAIEEKETQEIPDNVIVMANGTWKDKTTGRFLPGVKPTTAIQNRSQALELTRARWDKARDAAELGLTRLSGDSAYAAWADIVENQAKMAADAEKGRSSTEAAKFVGHVTGFVADRRQNDGIFVQNAQIAIVPGELLSSIVADMGELRNQVEQNDGMVVDN